MPLTTQYREFRFGAGQQEGEYAVPLDGPQVSRLLNARIAKGGGVEGRRGYVAAATGTANVQRLFGHGGVPHAVHEIATSVVSNNAKAFVAALNADGARLDHQGGVGMVRAVSEARILGRDPVARDSGAEVSTVNGRPYSSDKQINDGDFAVDTDTDLMVRAWSQILEQSTTAPGIVTVFAEVVDRNTLAVVTPTRVVSATSASAQHPRCINHNGKFYIVYDNGAANDIRCVEYTLSTRTWGTDTTLVTDMYAVASADARWDAVELEGATGTAWYLAYKNTTPALSVRRIVGATITHSATISGTPDVVALHAETTNGRVWISWWDSASSLIKGRAVDAATLGTQLVATTTIKSTTICWCIGIAEVSATVVLIAYTHTPTTSLRWSSAYATLNTSAVVGTEATRDGIGFLSRPRAINGVVFAQMLYDGNGGASAGTHIGRDSSGFATAFTVALVNTSAASSGTAIDSFRVAAAWMIGFAGARRNQSTLSNFRKIQDDADLSSRAGVFAFMVSVEVRQVKTGAFPVPVGVHGLDMGRISFDCSDRFKSVEFGGVSVICGGTTSVFDGEAVSEYGFWWPPENSGMADDGGGAGSACSAGDYQLAACWEYRMSSGDLMRSAPAIVYSSTGDDALTLADAHSIALSVSALTLTQKYNGVSSSSSVPVNAALVSIFRTEANGSIFYRDAPVFDVSMSFANNPLRSVDTFLTAFNDTDATTLEAQDISLIARDVLYTTDGILPNYPFPGCDDIVVWKDRLWGISSEDKRDLCFTHVKQQGELPGWHPFLVQRVEDGGDAIGIAVMDEKLIVFKRDAIYAVYGDGPDRKGVGGGYVVQRVQTEHGCRDRRSIVAIPEGIMFASRRGICLLGRSLTVKYVGGPVEDTEEGLEYVAAVALANEEQVYFSVRTRSVGSGGLLVYHWDIAQWVVDTITRLEGELPPFTTVALIPQASAYVAGEYYAAFDTDPIVYLHSGYVDPADSWIPMQLRTPWFKVGGIQGFGRCRWLELIGEYRSAHGLTIGIERDYSVTSQTVTLTPLETAAAIGALYQPKIHVAEQKGQAYRVTLLTVDPVGTLSAVVQTGGGPAVTLSGPPPTDGNGLITMTSSAALGVATFSWSFGASSGTGTSGASVALGATGITALFAAGNFVSGTTYTWDVTEYAVNKQAIWNGLSLEMGVEGHTMRKPDAAMRG